MLKKRSIKLAIGGAALGATLALGVIMPAHAAIATGFSTQAQCNKERLAYQRAGYQTQQCQIVAGPANKEWGFFYTGNGSRTIELNAGR